MRACCTVLFFALVLSACQPQAPTPNLFPSGTIVDLSHPYNKETVYWPTAEGFRLSVDAAGFTEAGYYYMANSFCTSEHGGTHVDAPIHFAAERHTMEQVPLENMMGQAIVVDVTEQAAQDRDYQIDVAALVAWEAVHGPLPDGSIVLFRTGFAQYWPDRVRYMGTDERGPEAVAKLHFPGLHPEAAAWMIANRNIKAVGIDTPSIDFGQSSLYESHQLLFKENIPAFENVGRMDTLPAKDFVVIALPMKIEGGSGAPLRIIAILPDA